MKKALLVLVAAMAAILSVAQDKAPKAPNPDQAPAFATGQWLNTKDGKPVTLESRKGKPTLVAFWTFACINCQNNLAPYKRLLEKYRPKGVELISIHTPEIRIERDVDEVKKHVEKYKIDYPVLIDNDLTNWKAWHVNVWPTLYVVDGDGIVICRWLGELNWKDSGGEAKIAQVLDQLLAKSKK